MATAALMVFGLLEPASGADVAPVVAEAEGEADSAAGKVVTVDLDYREVGYSFINYGLPMTTRSEAFKKEPRLSPSKVVRGTVRLGGPNQETGFAMDHRFGYTPHLGCYYRFGCRHRLQDGVGKPLLQ